MARSEKTMLDIPGCVIELSGEANPGKGEDAYGCFLDEDGCSFAVFDGCGGSGAQTYPCFDGKTGAYVAARKCRDAYFKWYLHYLNERYVFTKANMAKNLSDAKEYFQNALFACADFAAMQDGVRENMMGSMVRSFPTTVSAILCDYYDEVFSVGFLWAGNSRGYVLNANGLAQITEDDIFGEGDALDNLRNDDSLSNLLNADSDFSLRGLYYHLRLPVILITATDGCFDYLPSPMHFEDMLLSTMQASESYEEWRAKINDILGKCSSDDYSIILGCFGFRSFAEMKRHFAKRQLYVRERYVLPLMDNYEDKIDRLWQDYKPRYYRR